MIAFREFTKRYGRETAVDRFSLDVEAGEIVALLGPNGSGKTTTLKGAAGLIRPTSGTVLVGAPPRPASDAAARRAISFLPQRVELPVLLTAREVVTFYCRLREAPPARADEVLRFASLNGASNRAVGTFSGGMVQRLGLAVAMIPESAALLLDEPSAALDASVTAAFHQALQDRRRAGCAVLFSTHRLGGIEELADRFAILIHGRLAAVLTARELRARLRGHGVMRLTIGSRAEEALAIARRGFPGAQIESRQLVVPAPARSRPLLLDELRRRGIEIEELSTSERTLEDLYRELVGEAGDEAQG